MRLVVLCFLCALTIPASADEVLLKGGGRLVGEIVERSATSVVLETAPGRVSVPLARVERITQAASALAVFRQRADQLAPEDVAGWLALGLWARERGLATQATLAFEHVVDLDPANAEAHTALGRVRVNDRWMSREEGYRAQGMMKLGGEWLTREEWEARLAERRAEAEADHEQRTADARQREADARAEQAEADARRAQAEAEVGPRASALSVPWWTQGSRGNCRNCARRPGAIPRRHRPAPTGTPAPLISPSPQTRRETKPAVGVSS